MGEEIENASGVPEDTVLETVTHEGEKVQEKIVYDEDGGFHKEVVDG